MALLNCLLAVVPILMPGWYLLDLVENPVAVAERWLQWVFLSFTTTITTTSSKDSLSSTTPPVSSQLLAYLGMGLFGFVLTDRLVPHIKEYTLRKGICGKDMGKRGTPLAEKPV